MSERVATIFASVVLVAAASSCNQPTTPAPSSGGSPPPVVLAPVPAAIVLGTGTSITIGQHVSDTVMQSDPACYPNWDSTGRCRQFTLVAPQGGTLRVTLSWSSSVGDAMDLFVVSPDGNVAAVSDGTRAEQLTFAVTAGARYEFLAMAYSLPQAFDLDSQFLP